MAVPVAVLNISRLDVRDHGWDGERMTRAVSLVGFDHPALW